MSWFRLKSCRAKIRSASSSLRDCGLSILSANDSYTFAILGKLRLQLKLRRYDEVELTDSQGFPRAASGGLDDRVKSITERAVCISIEDQPEELLHEHNYIGFIAIVIALDDQMVRVSYVRRIKWSPWRGWFDNSHDLYGGRLGLFK